MANSDVLVRMKADTQNYDANIAKARRQLDQFKKDNLSLGGVMKQSTTALTSMAGQFMGVAAAIGAAKKVMGDMVRINMQFEQSSSNLAAVMGKSRDEITALTDQAKQLGATTQYTANQILELQANLARLGFNETEILNSTKAVQGMATAMGADLGEAANLAGSALRGFGMNATEMERVASVLSVGTTKSALSFEKLATALPVVQTAAAKTGFTIEDTVAMLGKLTDNGINAASAATQLRKILNDSTTAGTKLANALGGPVKSFDELVVALDKAGKAGQNHADSVALVNSKNATALDILRDMAQQREVDVNGVKKQTSALQDLRDSITDCSDGMRAMQDEQLNTLQGSITILNSAWEGLMLTFSESNGAIKTVTDSLTSLLTAYTNWRKRQQGGDAAITTYELGVSDEQRKNATSQIERQRSQGMSDADIAKAAESRKAAYEKDRDAMKDLLAQWEKAGKQGWGSKAVQDLMGEAEAQFGKMEGAPYKWAEQMYNIIAGKNDRIAMEDFIIGSVTAPEPGKKTASEEGDQEDKSKGFLAKRKAQIEAEEKLEISKLDRMAMAEEEYEKKVYEIKRAALEQIAKLYQEDTTDRAKADAAISSLDIQYQGTQMRLANKGNKGTTAKPKEEYTGFGEYSNKAVSARMSHAKSVMDSSEFGSDRYLYEADKLVDLTTFQNLLKEATTAGMTIDPERIKEWLQGIDMSLGVSDESWETLVKEINDKRAALDLPPIELDVKTGNVKALDKQIGSLEQNLTGAINVFGQLGDAMQQIDDPGAKVAGIIMGAIANIAGTFAASLKGTFTPWDWIAAAISGTATMISTIAAIKSATSGNYANGGLIPGNSFSGDNLTANVNSGELILNRSQQDSIASQLTNSNPFGNLALSMNLKGEDIQICLDNNRMRRGR